MNVEDAFVRDTYVEGGKVEFAVLDLVADLMVVKSLFSIEDVGVAVTTATTLVGLSLPDNARMDEEMAANTFDLDDRFARRLDLIVFNSISEAEHNLTFKIAFLTFLSLQTSI